MGVLEAEPQVEKRGSWIWRIVILIIIILFVVGFYLLLSGDALSDLLGWEEDNDSSDGSWLDNLGGGDDPEEDVIPAPPALPS